MANKVFNKFMNIVGLADEYDDIEEIDAENEFKEEKEEEVTAPVSQSKRNNKVVNIHTASSAKVIIAKPTAFEDATNIADDLKNRKIIVVNTTGLDPKVAQRMLDFMGGSSYALGGELQEIEKGVYILSPSNVEVTNELKNELSSRGIFGWAK